ncbi:RNA polymerase sigma factor [Catalinimonas niigatensis]|uniref:RNA polymerase sigma factor n=1 Tax=Catalinimonas niigatensis TaxID=1397264 RepID=UPI0026651CC0|nr:sigma-70 family RNA polymerase sigma factor [Catalinimonas niigatensis]WPP52380.1 sigma-70 family RNA polymerase sigma factor [Catalinimonas niigatensis]
MKQEQLVDQLRKKDREALSYLYDHYADAIYGVVQRIVGQNDVAEEVLQDAFMRYWEKIDQYDPAKGRLFTWMLRIARNLALDKLRSKGMKQQGKSDSISDNVGILDSKLYTETVTDPIGLESALKDLNEEQRFVVDKLYFRGYTQSELAKEYNIPLGTVKTRLRAAMVRLRKLIVP